MPWTNITKVTDLSELKQGEAVRVISRKIDDKNTAMGIVFGNIKNAPAPSPYAPQPPTPGAQAAKKIVIPATQANIKK